jgi:predicted TIM-barrel fold metal-dependent hydrolase
MIQSRRQIVDAHHHLWDLGTCRYPWLEEKGVLRFFGDPAPIQRNYLHAELRDDAANYELSASVHIQVGVAEGDELRESEWLEECATDSGLPSAIVAFCDLASPAAERQLALQQSISRVRGIRQIVGRSAEEDAHTGSAALLEDSIWIDNLGTLRDRELSFDLQLVPQQARRAANVFRQISGLRVALCHCGSPWDQSRRGLASWREGLAALAENQDMYCKISGLAMFKHDWSIGDIEPIIRACIDIFSPQRCMFGSNFPVDKLHKSYAEIWGAYEEMTAQYSDAEQAMMFAGTAQEFYRLG